MKYLVIPLFAISTLMVSCDKSKSAIEQVKSITEDKYPVANMPDEPLEKPLEIVREPKRLAMTSTWSAGVKDDGTLWTWGTGSLLDGRRQSLSPVKVEGVNDALAVSGGSGHMLLLRKDGTVWGWGSNHDGQIDPNDKDTSIEELRQIKGIDNVVDIVASSDNSLFITNKGDLYILGINELGLINGKIEKRFMQPTKINGFTNVVKADLTLGSIIALTYDGKVITSGIRDTQTGIPNAKPIQIDKDKKYFPPTYIPLNQKVVDIVDGLGRIVLLENGKVLSWGDSINANTAQGTITKDFNTPTIVKGVSKVINITDNAINTQDGNIYVWGTYNTKCKNCINISKKYFSNPVKIASNTIVTQFVDGNNQHAFIDKVGDAWYWGNNRYGEQGIGTIQKEEYISEEELFTLKKSLFNIHQ